MGKQQLTLQEAQLILGVESTATWEEVMKKFDHLFAANEKHGSFYLQSKIYRARERLEQEFIDQGKPMPGHTSGQEQQQQQQQSEGGQQQ